MKKNPLLKLAAAALFSGVSGVFADITYDITSDYVLDADYSISQIQTVSNGATYTIAKSLTNSASGYVLTLSNGKTEILEGGSLLITSANSGIKLDQKSTLTVDGGKIRADKITAFNGSTLDFKTANATDSSAITRLVVAGETIFNMGASQTLGLDVRTKLNYNAAAGSLLTVDYARVDTNGTNANIFVENPDNLAIFFKTGNDFANVYSFDSGTGRLFITSTEYGYDVKSMTFSFRNGGSALSGLSFTAVEGGYMLQSVPEPAEWAAVFGAAALALALRRKTKNLRR